MTDTDQAHDSRMRKRGYRPVAECAEAIGCTLSTVYRWVRRGINTPMRKRGVIGVRLGSTTYVELESLYARVGAEACTFLKLREKMER